MSTPGDLDDIINQLAVTSVEGKALVSFAGQALKLDSEADAKAIVDAIAACPSLNILELKGNTLGIEAARAIGRALEKHPYFTRALWSDMFTGRMKTEIPDALKQLCGGLMTAGVCLVELDLSDNAFGPNGMKGLVDFLRSKSCFSLEELRLNNNGLGITGGLMLADSLLECHRASVEAGKPLALRIFVSGRGRLEDEGATALSKAFKAMKSLVEVHMPQNGINHKGITALADAFALNRQLRHINLSDNTFTERGSKAMAAAIPHLDQLEVVNFDDCLIRTAGVKALAAAMKNRQLKLKILKLSGNEISREGAEAVIAVATTLPQLELLDLNTNQLGVDGVEVVKELMSAAGKKDLLASLSDDEGTDDEEEGEEIGEKDEENSAEDDDEDKVKQEEVKGDSDEGEEDEIMWPGVHVHSQAADGQPICKQNEISSEATEQSIKAFLEVSSSVSEANPQSSDAAIKRSDEILRRLFGSASAADSTGPVVNALLVNLGLIKDEDRRYRTLSCMEGALITLEHAARQNYFPSDAKLMLATFLEKPSAQLNSCVKAKDALLHTLKG